ncbi:MAG: transposase [Aridibacter famidurans]|nr:transposase [Aridibacter famidurans]
MKRDYIDFPDRTWPEAFFITFRTDGTWFHGDERGSVNRRGKNRVGEPGIRPSKGLRDHEEEMLNARPMRLDHPRRKAVETAIRGVCSHRGYLIHTINVRTNHIHIVVSATRKPETVMNEFKSYATRELRKRNLIDRSRRVWARHGSTRYLWTEESVDEAVDYVVLGQGADLN